MKIHPRLGTGIVGIIYSVLFFLIIEIVGIDFEQVKILYFIIGGIIAIIVAIVLDRLYNKK